MQCYPALADPWRAVRIPLPDCAAERLMDAMLTENAAVAHVRLVSALRADPAMVLWSVLQQGQASAEVPTFSDLATTLQKGLPDAWTATQSFSEDEHSSDETVRAHADLAGRAIQCAEQSEQVARDDGEADSEQAYLLGQLSVSIAWIEAARANPNDPISLPVWLAACTAGAASGTDALPREAAIVQRVMQCFAESDAKPSPRCRDWTRRLPIADRLPDLASRLSTLGRLEASFASELEEEKLQAMYKLAAGAGHEINNPLGSIAGRAQLLLRDEADPDRQRMLAKINTQAFRAHEMISDMMLFAKPPTPVLDRVDLVGLIDSIISALQETARERSTQLSQASEAAEVLVEADRTQLTVAIQAMCTNAMEALGSGGHIELTTRHVPSDGPAERVQVVVRDDGPGIAPEQRQHIFDPFYSGREAGRGLGFGLSKCWRIVRNHGGQIEVESAPGCGATFTITLPAA